MTPEFEKLTQRYADLLQVESRSPRTIQSYLAALKGFRQFLGDRDLVDASADDVIDYQLDLAKRGYSDSTVRVATYALRGFFRKVLRRADWDYAKLPRPRRPKPLPEILSASEVEAVIAKAPSPKYRVAFMVGYGSGLRTEELLRLEPRHIDGERMVIRVERGKGRKDRQVVLSRRLLEELRQYWRRYRPRRYLFEGKRAGEPMDASSLQRAFQTARRRAGIDKAVTPKSLRHAFATHLVESGTNLRVVQALLGHHSLNTTAVYTHLARTWLTEVKSPLDNLKPPTP